MRTKYSLRNAFVGASTQVLSMLLAFVCRYIFTHILSAEYLGVEGLFSNILTLLSLSELGVGSAITFFMYKPIAENDTHKLRQLLQMYRSIYNVIGVATTVVGLGLTPFIGFFIKSPPQSVEHLSLIYVMYVLNLSLSYFFTYNASIIEANQKNYISTLIRFFFQCLQVAAQITLLLLTHNFILYLLVQVVTTLIINIVTTLVARRMYPYICQERVEPLDKEERHYIFKNVRAMFMHNIGNAVVNGTDNILISKFVGLVETGIYSNYAMIVRALTSLLSTAFAAVTASVGNLGTENNPEKTHRIFERLNFLDFWVFSFSTISFFVLSEPFLKILYGPQYVFPTYISLAIALNFYLSGMRQVVLRFRNAMGLFYRDRYKPVFESIINLVVSILLVQRFGIVGVFWGTSVSTLTTAFWIEPLILFKYGFHMPQGRYYLKYGVYALLTAAVGVATYFVAGLIPFGGIGGLLCRALVCLAIPNGLYYLIFRRTDDFQYFQQLFCEKAKAMRGKKDKTEP